MVKRKGSFGVSRRVKTVALHKDLASQTRTLKQKDIATEREHGIGKQLRMLQGLFYIIFPINFS